MSSGEVSARTKIIFLFSFAHLTASSALKTTCPVAAPGEAAKPFATAEYFSFSLGSKMG